MRVHAYERNPIIDDYLVVPIGKLKEKNRPYGSNPTTQRLIDIPQEMFDVSSLAYHRGYNIALISTNPQGPSDSDIENYLNSYLSQNDEYKIKLVPIMRNIELEKISKCERSEEHNHFIKYKRTFK